MCRRHYNFSNASKYCETPNLPALTSVHFHEAWDAYMEIVRGETSVDVRQAFHNVSQEARRDAPVEPLVSRIQSESIHCKQTEALRMS